MLPIPPSQDASPEEEYLWLLYLHASPDLRPLILQYRGPPPPPPRTPPAYIAMTLSNPPPAYKTTDTKVEGSSSKRPLTPPPEDEHQPVTPTSEDEQQPLQVDVLNSCTYQYPSSSALASKTPDELCSLLAEALLPQHSIKLSFEDQGASAKDIRAPRKRERLTVELVDVFFHSIETKSEAVLNALLASGLVTASTCNKSGLLPLHAAVQVNNLRAVEDLLERGAHVNAFCPVPDRESDAKPPVSYYIDSRSTHKPPSVDRTPLMLAAEDGHLALVKLLLETGGADDSVVAPDGELALRRAAANGHREVVEYLPARRRGGWKRWKKRHSKAMRRAEKAAKKAGLFARVLVWDIPKALLWSCPIHCIFKPLGEAMKWAVEHWREVPKEIADFVKDPLWRFTRYLAGVPTWLVTKLWHGLLKTPAAMKIAAKWLWQGLIVASKALGGAVLRLGSVLHTAFVAMVSLLKTATISDVWNGFKDFLHAVFVRGPATLWTWLRKFGDMTYDILATLFKCTGKALWYIGAASLYVVTYLPKQIGAMILSAGQSAQSGGREVLVWMNPKRI